MKQFLKYVLATVVGLLVTGAVLTVAGLATLGSLVAVGSATTEVTDGAVLRLRLTGEVTERVTENPLNTLMGADAEATGLDELLAAIRIAADDDRIDGIYLEGGVLLASPATLEELRDALVAFKRSGKFVVAYGDNYSQGAYYVASVADRVVLNPSGMLDWHGFAATPVFYKDLLEKVGVRMQVYRVGTYKSYVEPYTLTAMSEASRKQIDAYLHDIWSRICHEVAASRRVKVDSLNAYADRYTLLADARDYVRQGLVDTLAYVDGVRELQDQVAEAEQEIADGQTELDDALVELMALDFAIDELGLYLDTHRDDADAVALFNQYVERYADAMQKYEAQYGSLTQRDSALEGIYTWIDDPWPWDYLGKEPR